MENEELVKQIQAGINPTENMEQLYLQNRSFIYQQAKKYSAYAEMDDLMQEAYLGLNEAVEYFNPDMDVRFLTYLPFRLKKVFHRYIDNHGRTKRIPSHIMERIIKYKKYISERQQQGVDPSDFAICRDLNLTERQLGSLRKAIYEAHCISTNELMPGADTLTVGDSIADPLNMEEQAVEEVARQQAETLIWKIVGELEERQAEVIVGRYKESATLKEMGKRLNLSKDSIRAIEKNALPILRRKRKIRDIAEIYDYTGAYRGTGVTAFKERGSSVENAAIRHMEEMWGIEVLKRRIEENKKEIRSTLNINELFSEVLNLVSR